MYIRLGGDKARSPKAESVILPLNRKVNTYSDTTPVAVTRPTRVEAEGDAVTVKTIRTVELARIVEVTMTSVSITGALPLTAAEDCEFNSVNAPSAVEVAEGAFEVRGLRPIDVDEGTFELSEQFPVELGRVEAPWAVEVFERRMVEVSVIFPGELERVRMS